MRGKSLRAANFYSTHQFYRMAFNITPKCNSHIECTFDVVTQNTVLSEEMTSKIFSILYEQS